MRPMVPLQASIASLSSVLPDDACPTMAKLRMFAEGCVAITPRMKRKLFVCKFRERKVAIAGNVWRLAFGVWRLAFGVWAFGVRRSAFGGAVRTSVTLLGQDIGNTVTVLVH